MADNPKFGDVICVDRWCGIYKHYGIYIDDSSVIHYIGELLQKEDNIKVKETTLEDFVKDSKEIWIDNNQNRKYNPSETVDRARSQLGNGEGQYHAVFNNCEHFATWCQNGQKKSHQVEKYAFAFTGLAIGVGIGVLLGSSGRKKDNI
jgi:hypothetical protein